MTVWKLGAVHTATVAEFKVWLDTLPSELPVFVVSNTGEPYPMMGRVYRDEEGNTIVGLCAAIYKGYLEPMHPER